MANQVDQRYDAVQLFSINLLRATVIRPGEPVWGRPFMQQRARQRAFSGTLLLGLLFATMVSAQQDRAKSGTSDHQAVTVPNALPASPSVASPPALSLSPAVVMARGLPGQSMVQTLSISNQTSLPFNFDLVAQDVVSKDGKRTFVPAGETKGSIAATAVFSRDRVHVDPGQTASVDVTLTLPPETAIRAVVAMFRGVDKVPAQGGAVMMTASLGCLITFTTSDQFGLEVASVEVSPQSATRPMGFSALLVNSGTEPVVPEGMLAIIGPTGALVGKATFAPQRLLPGERLAFTTEYPSQIAAGHYRALASFQFEGKTLTNSSEFTVQ